MRWNGRHIIRNGDRPQKFLRSYDPMSEFYHYNKKLFTDNKVFVDRNVVLSGCFRSNKETLQQTMIPEMESEIAGLPSMAKIKVFSTAVKAAISKSRN